MASPSSTGIFAEKLRKNSKENSMIQADDLKVIAFLKDLSHDELETLSRIMKEKSYSEGEVVFEEGDPGDSLYLLAEGEVEVVKTMKGWYKETLSVFKKGRMFGEFSFLSGSGHSARARVTKKSRIFILEREAYQQLEKNDPQITQKFMKVIALSLSVALQRMNERFLHMVNYILGEEAGS